MKSCNAASPTVSDIRKIRKPMMEKKRRARINDSLESLKQILLECDPESSQKTGQKSTKLEKADILEMTVRYLQHLRRKSLVQRLGYQQAARENVVVSPADSSTCERVPPVAPDSCPIDFSNGRVNCGVLSTVGYFPKYNSGGVVYVVPSCSSSNPGRYLGEIPQAEPSETVWRPW